MARPFGKGICRGPPQEAGPGWKERRTEKNRLEKEAVLAQLNKERAAMAGVPPATDEEVRSLALRLYAAGIVSMLGLSALYNTLWWTRWCDVLRRLDHAALGLDFLGGKSCADVNGCVGVRANDGTTCVCYTSSE